MSNLKINPFVQTLGEAGNPNSACGLARPQRRFLWDKSVVLGLWPQIDIYLVIFPSHIHKEESRTLRYTYTTLHFKYLDISLPFVYNCFKIFRGGHFVIFSFLLVKPSYIAVACSITDSHQTLCILWTGKMMEMFK